MELAGVSWVTCRYHDVTGREHESHLLALKKGHALNSSGESD